MWQSILKEATGFCFLEMKGWRKLSLLKIPALCLRSSVSLAFPNLAMPDPLYTPDEPLKRTQTCHHQSHTLSCFRPLRKSIKKEETKKVRNVVRSFSLSPNVQDATEHMGNWPLFRQGAGRCCGNSCCVPHARGSSFSPRKAFYRVSELSRGMISHAFPA